MKPRPDLKIVVSNPPAPVVAEPAPLQAEMPFAVVNGEPISELPRDLYIPPQALEVFLEAFEGPLDLLLYLIRRQNLDILDIPLAEITRQYMQYIELMQDLQLELAGEYMVMAATLAEIKSRMLLPRPKLDEDSELDPRAELVRRLQEYERFKRAAEGIDALPRLERDVWPAIAPLKERQVVRPLPQITLQEMLLAFKDVVVRAHERHPRAPGRRRLPALHAAVPPRGGAHGRDGHLRRHPGADARGADRHRPGRGLRAAARARRQPRHAPARGERQHRDHQQPRRGDRGGGRAGRPCR
jgi:segregation and condensation protein A